MTQSDFQKMINGCSDRIMPLLRDHRCTNRLFIGSENVAISLVNISSAILKTSLSTLKDGGW